MGYAAGIVVLLMVGGGGIAVAGAGPADSGTVGFSPATGVVAKAPLAVSVTFAGPLRAQGARLQVISVNGDDVGSGPVTTGHKTLRRQLSIGAPGGKYSISWTAISASGHRMAGTFSFIAAHGNGPAPVGTASAQPTPNAVPTPGVEEFPPGQGPSVDGPSVQADSTLGEVAPPSLAAPSGQPSKDRGMPRGFAAVPLAVGALLVLAAGLVARLNRRRARA